MANNSRIEWTEATWNPVTGCTRASSGCDNCYAVFMTKRLASIGQEKYRGLINPGKHHFNGVIKIHPSTLETPLRWKKPRTIFVNSMSDLFHRDVPTEFILQVFDVMQKAHWHQFQVLTKRPERAAELDTILEWAPNIWMGTSVENQEVVHRIDSLRCTSAQVRFLSLEPLIGPLQNLQLAGIHWAIVGGESGRGARPMQEEWVRDIYMQCTKADVAFFFKQLGTIWAHAIGSKDKKGCNWNDLPESLRVRDYPQRPIPAYA